MHSSACLLYQAGGSLRKADSSSEESPSLMPVLPVLPEPACLAGFSLALEMAIGPILSLELALASSVLPAISPLSGRDSPMLALLALDVGTLRKAMTVPLSGRARLASTPEAMSTGSTSLSRFHSHLALLGHAMSRSTPRSSATAASFLCNSEALAVCSVLSSMNLR